MEDWGAAYVEKEEIHSYCEGILRYKGDYYYDWILNCQKKPRQGSISMWQGSLT